MLFAIKPRTAGLPVSARAIEQGWPLADGEMFTVETDDDVRDLVLAEDGKSLARKPPPEPEVTAWAPSEIIAAIKAIDYAKANAILAAADEVTKAEFFAARRVREDDSRLVTALAGGDITIADLKRQIAGK